MKDISEQSVLTAIQAGHNKLGMIMAEHNVNYHQTGYRAIDKALQRLRRAGKIAYTKGRWRALDATP